MKEINLGIVLQYLFPDADPLRDYTVIYEEELGFYIADWQLDEPVPTSSVIEAAYEAALEQHEKQSTEPSDAEKVVQLQLENNELKERQLIAESDNLVALAAIAEMYEMMLDK